MDDSGSDINGQTFKKSASFGDFSANLLKRKIFLINSKVENNKTDFSIVAPKTDNNEFVCNQSELDILGPMRNKEIKGSD